MANVANESLLKVDELSARYGRIEVLHRISVSVEKGEIVSIIGANGAGKTTLLKSIGGIKTVSHGRVSFAGTDITTVAAQDRVARGIALVPEGRQIFSRLTVLENLELGAYLSSDKAALAEDLEKIFTLFPVLKERLKQSGGTLSGGEQQMLAIGRALMSRPKLLLMDEPSMGVAPLLVAKIFETVQELNAQGLTILLVEQNAKLALKVARRAYVLEVGAITSEGEAKLLLEDERVQNAYLGGD